MLLSFKIDDFSGCLSKCLRGLVILAIFCSIPPQNFSFLHQKLQIFSKSLDVGIPRWLVPSECLMIFLVMLVLFSCVFDLSEIKKLSLLGF